MHRRHLNELLVRYAAIWPDEAPLARRFAAFAAAHDDCLLRSCVPGHITASAWIVAADGARCLLTHHKKLLLPENFGGETSFEAVRTFAQSKVAFDAIFAASDVLAIAAIHAVQSLGKSVPKDIAVVGYDNIGQSALATPAVTTVDQHIKIGGEMMVDLLLRKLAGEKVRSQVTPTKLVVRRSSVV